MKKTIQIKSIAQLKKEAKEQAEFYIVLNGSVMSSKTIQYLPESRHFCIHNNNDFSHQHLTTKQLATHSNIAEAIKKGAFYKEVI